MTTRTESTCPHCGAAVDPLRAGAVSIVGGRIIHFCSPACRAIHLNRADPSVPAAAPAAPGPGDEPAAGARAAAPRIAPGAEAARIDAATGLAEAVAHRPGARLSRLFLPIAIESAILAALAAAVALVPATAARGLLAPLLAAAGIAASAAHGVLKARGRGAARIAEVSAEHVAAALLVAAAVAGSASRYPLLCALVVLLADRAGRAAEILGRRRSGVLDVAAGGRPGLVADAWRDNSSTAARLRRVALVLGWARFPFAAALAAALLAAGLLALPDALGAAAVALLALDVRALRLATGDAHLAVALKASRLGIAIRDAHAVERLGAPRIALFMARRTLLAPGVGIVDWRVAPGVDEAAVAAQLAALESRFDGRFAEAIAAFAAPRATQPLPAVDAAEASPGVGVAGRVAGATVLCGTRRLFLERGVSNAEHEPWAAGVEATGRRALFVGVDGRIAAMFAVEEEPVQGAEEVVRALALLGMEPALTTSAEADAARALGARIGVERVHFEVREPGIGEVLTGIEAAGDSAVLVGHGPAFEEAARGAKAAVALGGAGATLADVDMRDNALGHLVPLVAAARDARASVRWNAAGLGVALGAGVGLAATWPTPGAAVVVAALGALAGAACTFNRPYPLAARLLHGAAQRLERAWKAVLARSRRL